MHLRELIFQGIFNSQSAVRLEFPTGVGHVALPSGLSHEDVQELLISMLYESETSHQMRVAYGSTPSKLALMVEHQGRKYRFVRMSDPATLRVQIDEAGTWTDVAKGDRVQSYVRQTLALPDFMLFWCVNLWRFEEEPPSHQHLDLSAMEPRVRDLVQSYRQAVAAESLDDTISRLEGRINACTQAQGDSAALEAKLERAWEKMKEYETGDLAEEDVGLIREKESRLGEYRDKLERLSEEEDVEREEIYRSIPLPWAKRPEFWVGLVITLASIGVSLALHDTPYRMVAMGNILGLGVCAWTLLSYFTGMEKASVHQIRLESIKRRLNQVREEQVALQEHLNHLMIHAEVDNSQELTARVANGAKLRVMIEKMEKRMATLRRDPEFQRLREEKARLITELDEAQSQRSEFSQDMMGAYQIESDLVSFGLDPEEVLKEAPQSEGSQTSEVSVLERLLGAAKLAGQLEEGALVAKTRKMWGKIAGHILGERFSDVDVLPEAQLRISGLGESQMEMWRSTRASEERVVLFALALATQVNAPERTKYGLFDTVVIRDPAETVTSDQAKKLGEVFKSAGRRSDVALLSTDV